MTSRAPQAIIKIQKETKHPNPVEPEKIIREIVRSILIRNIDRLWQDHLLNIDHLRTEVGLQTVGQKDPLLEFKHEAFALFEAFSINLRIEIAHALFKFTMILSPPEEESKELKKKIKRAKLTKDKSLLPELT